MEENVQKAEKVEGPHYFIVRVTIGREMQVFERFKSQIPKEGGIYSIIKPYSFKGYIIVEARDIESVHKLIYNIKHVRGIIKKEISLEEVLKSVKKKEQVININIGDVVKVLSGPFKGENASVKSINKEKGEVGVMFLESAVPISVNIKISDVMVTKTEEKNESQS
ncbi:transcription elongation factor Spt5 [Candidatus Parvarchaeota archaeon]|jgi:transcriptional antiterminator NusG|uniref:Transcription elongation factor Spt5 n=1 Tax=Candidatus Acidifodinimicrobium mancum TaxID=2898728 RepID=A0A8T3USG2_9ARCH|nr:transcription elongation factor Spt5 [Candidatus Acidifodinimicrobium mancum]MBE5728611.1 transcription elongation factor Spt5 [Candidatus Acidifodinimicrobium mancum]MBE5728803.1 transcription elongation factor Spt5 [Candidatus Acidifodinimicrobium mancum]MBE5729398.1 transcription elongation factor Spt5 [Candidatus Acidifodinimicrobium mancum]MBE5730157.1 transcription elongation factor Spt5 [Candidatus Acidifodinimicrobium mancum]